MTDPNSARMTLLVLYSPRLDECRRFYGNLGLRFTPERHGQGPDHYAAVLADGTVFELYPARPDRRTDALRLGFAIDGATASPPLAEGRHLLTDPDGRTVEVHAT
ncbi:glyoxalase/bleomycin resistance/dioxygenase family protein [Streptomyces sp. V2]|uniref:glyoxalase/bleomycin resistance/dioxygenase family protein n=1 Tax=Streptomyces sp. V2 TaxID=1424099 RepID=UPI000D66D699|nr:glyoxalase/bleomycin resistance/dioxygenase family protein [Streptomyces sp. V2]PWG14217.1 glyoxalase/bleomycin resistance/dioxygenase family protein [Streptomyces sp. V2]